MLALLGCLGLVRRRYFIFGLFLVCWIVYMVGMLSIPADFLLWPYRMSYWVRMIACFFAGASFYLYRDRIPCSGRYALISVIVGLLLCVSGYGFVPMLPIFGAYSVFYLAFSRYVPGHTFGQRGDFSYGVYLYAFPIQQVLVHYYGVYLVPLSLFILAWMLTMLCAWFSWTFVERPCLQRTM